MQKAALVLKVRPQGASNNGGQPFLAGPASARGEGHRKLGAFFNGGQQTRRNNENVNLVATGGQFGRNGASWISRGEISRYLIPQTTGCTLWLGKL